MFLRFLAITFSLALIACASPVRYQEHAAAKARFDKLTQAESWLELDLIPKTDETDAVQRKEIEKRMPNLQPCFDLAIEQLSALGNRAGAGLSWTAVIEGATSIDARMNSCTAAHGVSSSLLFEVEKEFFTLSAYLGRVIDAAELVQITGSLVREEEKANAAALALGLSMRPLSSGLVNVRPYVRSDGVFVPGHIRTTPDGFCFNNLGGCR